MVPAWVETHAKLTRFVSRLTKMFSGNNTYNSPDEELALNIIHKFNIDRDTLETMPAFEENLKSLFGREKEK